MRNKKRQVVTKNVLVTVGFRTLILKLSPKLKTQSNPVFIMTMLAFNLVHCVIVWCVSFSVWAATSYRNLKKPTVSVPDLYLHFDEPQPDVCDGILATYFAHSDRAGVSSLNHVVEYDEKFLRIF